MQDLCSKNFKHCWEKLGKIVKRYIVHELDVILRYYHIHIDNYNKKFRQGGIFKYITCYSEGNNKTFRNRYVHIWSFDFP
jgi:hypothetical protein